MLETLIVGDVVAKHDLTKVHGSVEDRLRIAEQEKLPTSQVPSNKPTVNPSRELAPQLSPWLQTALEP